MNPKTLGNTVCLLSFLLLFVFTGECLGKKLLRASVLRVVDGDTLVVRYRNTKMRVRLWGIDSPERKQAFSGEAKKFAERLLLGRRVKIYPKDRDDYDRLVAIVKVGGKCVNEELIKAGLAWVHIRYCREKICDSWRRRERKARKRKLGLWHDANPAPPWEWKRKHR